MFKLFVFVALLSFAAARPGLLGPATIIHEPSIIKVGLIPSAVSHQSTTQIHSRPIITSVVSPVLPHLPLVHAPLLQSHVVAGPILGHPHPLWL